MNYTFENYSDKESYAYKAAVMFAERMIEKDDLFNPLYIYGDNERKREHLTTAIFNAIVKNQSYSIVDISTEVFICDLIHAIQSCINLNLFLQKYFAELVIIRNIHLIIGHENASWELFRLVDYLLENGSKIVFTTYASPIELVEMGLYERYTSRATCGLVCSVDRQYFTTNSGPYTKTLPRSKVQRKRNRCNNRTHKSSKRFRKQYKCCYNSWKYN